MTKQLINPSTLPEPRGFSHAVLCSGGRVLFLAGQDASDSKGHIVAPGDVVKQYEQVLKNLQAVVQEAGGQMTDIVKLNIFVKDRHDYKKHLRELGKVHKKFFGNYFPAFALLEVNGFYREENLIELEGFAYLE